MEMHREMVLLAIEALLMEALLIFGVDRMISWSAARRICGTSRLPSYQPCQA